MGCAGIHALPVPSDVCFMMRWWEARVQMKPGCSSGSSLRGCPREGLQYTEGPASNLIALSVAPSGAHLCGDRRWPLLAALRWLMACAAICLCGPGLHRLLPASQLCPAAPAWGSFPGHLRGSGPGPPHTSPSPPCRQLHPDPVFSFTARMAFAFFT